MPPLRATSSRTPTATAESCLANGYSHSNYRSTTTSGAPATYSSNATYGDAGYGQGGHVYVTVNTGSIDVSGQLTMSASGTGGSIDSQLAIGYGGEGDGGRATIGSYGPGSITVGAKTNITANGTGGDGVYGGDGYGGTVGVSAQDGTIEFDDSLYLAARGQGGDANVGFGGDGGYGQGGNAYIEALSYLGDTSVSGTIIGADATVDISGFGGMGGAGNSEIAAGHGGRGHGGVTMLMRLAISPVRAGQAPAPIFTSRAMRRFPSATSA